MKQINSDLENKIAIFRNESGDIEVNVVLNDETVWLSLNQLTEVFGRDKSVISRHLRNIFKEGELEHDATVAKFATVQAEGEKSVTRQIEYYNLEAIISVGYRVNSKRGVEFRRWANSILKEYLIKGYSINHQKVLDNKLMELKQVVGLLSDTLINQGLVNQTGQECLSLIKGYAKTWDILVKYDENRLELPKASHDSKILKYEEAKDAINSLKRELMQKQEASDLFGRERDNALQGIIGNLYQTFDGQELYPSTQEKAAHLIYFIIKDHPFTDGNKRGGCLLFLLLLQMNKHPLDDLSPEALTAIALLIAESNPADKELLIKLVVNLLEGVKT